MFLFLLIKAIVITDGERHLTSFYIVFFQIAQIAPPQKKTPQKSQVNLDQINLCHLVVFYAKSQYPTIDSI